MIKKIVLLLAALLTPVYMFLFFFKIGSEKTILFYQDILLYVIIFGLFVMIYFIIHAKRNNKLDKGSKQFWIVVLILTSFPAQLLYWFFEILPKDKSLIN